MKLSTLCVLICLSVSSFAFGASRVTKITTITTTTKTSAARSNPYADGSAKEDPYGNGGGNYGGDDNYEQPPYQGGDDNYEQPPYQGGEEDYTDEDDYTGDDPRYTAERYTDSRQAKCGRWRLSQEREWNQCVGQKAAEATGGDCDMRTNPHSYSCTYWVYHGNPYFPLNTLNVSKWKKLKGAWPTWKTVTYVNITDVTGFRGHTGPVFTMVPNFEGNRPSQPLGVINTNSGDSLGKISFTNKGMKIPNWAGEQVNSYSIESENDGYTVSIYMKTSADGYYDTEYTNYGRKDYVEHAFKCVDFNRNGKHHVLCNWWVRNYAYGNGWEDKGFLGFLSWENWQYFLDNLRQ